MSNLPSIEVCSAQPIVTADDLEHPTLVLITWSPAVSIDWVVQIYVNGELFDVVTRSGVDRYLLRIDRGEQAIIELFAVHPLEPWTSRPVGLTGFEDPPICGLTIDLPRDAVALDPTLRLGVRVDGELRDAEPIWTIDAARPGFGLRFGEEDFGFGFTVGPGFGATEAGEGPFGCGGTRLRKRIDLTPGKAHAIEAVLIDSSGNVGPVIAQSEIEPYAVARAASPVRTAGGFDLTWTLPTA